MPCSHIQAALRCFTEAQPLTLKNTVLSILNLTTEMKQVIYYAVAKKICDCWYYLWLFSTL
jgi:hypothetical protein